MDDGNKTKYSYVFNTQSFNLNERNFLIKLLKRKFNIKCSLQKDNSIYIFSESSIFFYNLIFPYILESMKYKLISHNKRS